ncbi:hypothetical protein EXS71_01545 [Candidatus Uhrbacteria bacterium]|nr:hypothetical protein [Candidatus Uhrbacteria bacterium]
MPSLVENHSATWIKVWIGLGGFAFFLFLIIPATLGSAVLKDRLRFVQCQNGQRKDCGGSAIWAMYDWNLSTVSSTQNVVSGDSNQATTEPRIESVSITNATYDGAYYRVEIGTQAEVIAHVTNVKSVTMYLNTIVKDKPVHKRITSLELQKDGSYRGTFLVSPGLKAELELEAVDPIGHATSLGIRVAAK